MGYEIDKYRKLRFDVVLDGLILNRLFKKFFPHSRRTRVRLKRQFFRISVRVFPGILIVCILATAYFLFQPKTKTSSHSSSNQAAKKSISGKNKKYIKQSEVEKKPSASSVNISSKDTEAAGATITIEPTLVNSNDTNTEEPSQDLPASAFKIPEELAKYNGDYKINVKKGSLKMSVYADWVDYEVILLWGNFDGRSKENLFEIAGRGPIMIFNTYSERGDSGKDSLEAYFVPDYKGRTFEVEVRWDFSKIPGTKEIYVDGELKGNDETDEFPISTNTDIFIHSYVSIL